MPFFKIPAGRKPHRPKEGPAAQIELSQKPNKLTKARVRESGSASFNFTLIETEHSSRHTSCHPTGDVR